MTKEETQRACMRIGDNIARYLNRAGMTQRMLAAHADITEVSISRYISGDRGIIQDFKGTELHDGRFDVWRV